MSVPASALCDILFCFDVRFFFLFASLFIDCRSTVLLKAFPLHNHRFGFQCSGNCKNAFDCIDINAISVLLTICDLSRMQRGNSSDGDTNKKITHSRSAQPSFEHIKFYYKSSANRKKNATKSRCEDPISNYLH